MKRKIIAAIMATLFMVPSFCYAGIPTDKQEHIGVAAGLDMAMAGMGVKKETRWCVLAGLIIGKEVYDHNKPHPTHDHAGDIVAGVGGVLLGEGVVWIVHKRF